MTPRLFGTDGIRGKPGVFPLNDDSIIRLGDIVGRIFSGGNILIGRDPRESGESMEGLLARGIGSHAKVSLTGVIPTPGICHLLRRHRFDCGIMISASHNPAEENGIKFFNRRGEKLSPRREDEIERRFRMPHPVRAEPQRHPASAFPGREYYLEHLQLIRRELPDRLPSLVVDGANGAASSFAPALFGGDGARSSFIHCRPDGQNINRDSGSTSPQSLRDRVLEEGADLGIAFDGDADRVVFVDGQGRLLEGDHTLYALAGHFLRSNPDFPRTVVGTVMANLGLEQALKGLGIEFVRTDVGDRSVFLELKRRRALLGGEPCGHIIMRQYQPCGDGLLTALTLLRSLAGLGWAPADLFRELPLFPQRVVSLTIDHRRGLADWPELQELEREFQRLHGAYSRLVLRYSGTEPKIRLMIESRDESLITKYVERFSEVIRSENGGKE